METFDTNSITSKCESKKFVKENDLLRLLPNYSEIDKYADELFDEIKKGLIFAMKDEQYYENFNFTLKLLRRYIKHFSLRFSKEDFLSVIKALYGVMIQKNIDVVVFLNVLVEMKSLLRRPKLLSRNDLKVDWKPLYDIFYYHTHSSMAKNGMIYSPKPVKDNLVYIIRLFSNYFTPESTEEIWLLARPFLHYPPPYQTDKHNGLKILKLLLPFYYNNRESFFNFVWPHLLEMINIPTWNNICEHDLMVLFERAASTYVGLIDWSPYLERLFTVLLRSLKIKVAGITKKSRYNNTKSYVDILIYSIYGDNCVTLEKFRQFFKAINHLYHPSSQAQNTNRLLNLLHQISSALLIRYQNERIKKPAHPSMGFYPTKYFLTDSHIRELVEIILPSCRFAIFTKSKSDFGAVLSSIQKFGSLCPEVVVPACLELFHETSETILQPHRTLSTLAVVSMLHVPILNSGDRYPEGKLAVFPLMHQLLSYMNINDPPKAYISMICFGNLANILWIEDLSDKVDENLTPFEKEIALATAHFNDLILRFFDKLFEIIEIGFSESEMVETQRCSDFKTEMLVDVVIMMMPSICTEISRQVLDKTLDFAFSHSFSTESIQHLIGAIFACLLEKEELSEYGLQTFMPKYMRYFRDLNKDDYMIIGEKVDFKFLWLSALLPGFMKTKLLPLLIDDIIEVLQSLTKYTNSEVYKLIDLLLSYCLNICTHTGTTLEFINVMKNKNFHLNNWSGLITKQQLCSTKNFILAYTIPGIVEENFLDQIVAHVIRPAIMRLRDFTQIVREQKEDKIANKELRGICCILSIFCDSHENKQHNEVTDGKYIFDSAGASLPNITLKSSSNGFIINRDRYMLSCGILNEIKQSVVEAVSAVKYILITTNNPESLPVPCSDLEDLFRLLYRSHDICGNSVFYGQNKAFLDRRFDSFLDPVKQRSNTGLNWLLAIDDLHQRSCKPVSKFLTKEIVQVADFIFPFLSVQNSSLQKYVITCLYNFTANYLQFDEYIIQKILLFLNDSSSVLNESIHSGICQLLLKIFENRTSYESMTFVYKMISIFIILSQSQHVDRHSNKNFSSKLFDTLVQLMSTFDLSCSNFSNYDFQTIISSLSKDLILQEPLYRKDKQTILQGRRELYMNCINQCFSLFLIENSSTDGVPEFISNNINSRIKPTVTWQNIYHMSIILPLHCELPIPVKFLELFFLILFSPSKELASQGCNQINIVVWLLKQKLQKRFIIPQELSLPNPGLTEKVSAGPRNDNVFLIIEKTTNFWELSDKKRFNIFNTGYLWWPQSIKQTHFYETEDIALTTAHSDGNNQKCWSLLGKIFESNDFHTQLSKFLLNLGSQFLREEESQTVTSPFNILHLFSLDHLVCSILLCSGPTKSFQLLWNTFENLVKCSDVNQVYCNKLATQLLSGIIMSTKCWSKDQNQSFFTKKLLLFIDLYLENACKSELLLISTTLIGTCESCGIDVRQLLPVYNHFIDLLTKLEHDVNKEAVCLNFINAFAKHCSWRVGSGILDDLCWIWRKFVLSSSEKLRKEAGKTMKLLIIFQVLLKNFKLYPIEKQETYLKFPLELTQMFATQTHLILKEKGLEASELTINSLKMNPNDRNDNELSDEDSLDSSINIVSDTNTPSETPPNEPENDDFEDTTAAHKILTTMIQSLTEIFCKLGEFFLSHTFAMFTICIDLIPIRDKMSLYSHLRHCALAVSNVLLSLDSSSNEDHCKISCVPLLSFVENAIQHRSWRVRSVAAKMVQIISFNNLFIISRSENLKPLVKLVFRLLTDPQIEVRKEAANILSGLIQCSLFDVNSNYIQQMCARITKSPTLRMKPEVMVESHSGILGLCAFIQAHPFDIPSNLPEVLTVLCRYINRAEPISGTIKETLARFKKNHQETWHMERQHFTDDQLCALTDVLVSPSYYA